MERGFSAKSKQGNRKNSRKCGSSAKNKQRNRTQTRKWNTVLLVDIFLGQFDYFAELGYFVHRELLAIADYDKAAR